MDTSSHTYRDRLYSQIEDAFGKVLYSYTTQIVEAAGIARRNKNLKWAQLVLSAITTGGFVGLIITDQLLLKWMSGLCSTVLLVLTAYFKDVDLSASQKKHLDTSNKLWVIREKYISLLTDFEFLEEDKIVELRDSLQEETGRIYNDAPITSEKSYSTARDLIKNNDAQFFTKEELNKMLPRHLREG